MSSFLRTILPLMLAVVLGVTVTPAHAGAVGHATEVEHASHGDGHCASHTDRGHATMVECLQSGPCISLSQCAVDVSGDAAPARTWYPADDAGAKQAPFEVLTPPPRSA